MSMVRSSRAALQVEALFSKKSAGTKKMKAAPKKAAKAAKKAVSAVESNAPKLSIPNVSLPKALEDGKDELPLPIVIAIPLITAIFYYVAVFSKL